jgi:hypothetical protein
MFDVPPERSPKLRLEDIVGEGMGAAPIVLAYAAAPSPGADARFVAAGLFADEAAAQQVARVLARMGSVDLERRSEPGGTRWRVVAGPFRDSAEAEAAAAVARKAGTAVVRMH